MSAKCQKATFAPQQTALLFDHLIGAGQQCRWHLDAEGLRGRQIYYKIKLCRLLDRDVGRLGPAQNLSTNSAVRRNMSGQLNP